MREADFQTQVLQLAKLYHWKVAHFGNTVKIVRRKSGPITIPDKGAAGFPDLVMTRWGQLIFAELKSETGRLSDNQMDWLEALSYVAATGDSSVRVCIWRPDDLSTIQNILK